MWTLLPKEYTSEYEQKHRLFEKYPEREYILYSNDTHHLLPRYFHINYPYDKLIIHIDKKFIPKDIVDVEFTQPLLDYQEPIVKTFIDKYNSQGYVNGLLNARPGSGKCHGKGTKILLYDGSIKTVEDIVVGDQLMGDDSTPRNVLSTTIGYGKLYNVIPTKGDTFVCNEDHVLSLKMSGSTRFGFKHGEPFNIEIKELLTKSKSFNHKSKLWRTGVEFLEQPIKYEPYVLGYYIGNGTICKPSICCHNDHLEVINYFHTWSISNNIKLITRYNSTNSNEYYFSTGNLTWFNEFISDMVINNEKRIPIEYLINSRLIRLELLAGLLDSDGHLMHGENCYEIITKYEGLSNDILYLARSLGFASNCKIRTKTCKQYNFTGQYYQVTIYGNTNEIPCKLKYKQATPRLQIKNHLVTGFDLEPIGEGDYYGFELDGNGLYLLSDFTVTHNTAISLYLACQFKRKTLIVVDNQKLKEQFIETIVKFTNLTEDDIGFIQGSKFDTDKPITITMVQTLLSKLKRNLKDFYVKIRDCGFDFVIYDEVHKTSAGPKYAMSTLFINSQNIIGLSATPYVRDVHALLLFNTIGDIIHTSKDYECIPKIIYATYDSHIDQRIKNRSHYMRDYIKLQSFYNSVIYDNIQYLGIIYKLVKKCVESGHTTIVLVSTVKQIESIIEHLAKRDITAEPLYSKKPDVDKVNSNVLVGTFKFCSAGFDFKELSALILASPYKGKISLVQSIGRILRTSTGKKQPVVFDLMDKQFPSLFESNISGKNKIFSDEFKNCEIRNIIMD